MKIALFCPKMKIQRVGFRQYRTAVEPMRATLTQDDGTTFVIEPVTIPETDIHVHLLAFPQIALVEPCTGSGGNSIGFITVDLPAEPVMVELSPQGMPILVAKSMRGCPLRLMLTKGELWRGTVDFPDAVTDLLNGGAEAVTATGVLTKI